MTPQRSTEISAQAIAVITGSFLSGMKRIVSLIDAVRSSPIVNLGAMMSLSLMAVPVFLDTTTQSSQLYHQWVRMYHYGHQVLPWMAVATLLLYGYAAINKRATRRSWAIFAVAGMVTVSMLPFTWIFMVPTNDTLFRLEVESQSGMVSDLHEAQELVKVWSWLHFVRSLFPLVGAALGLAATLRNGR